MKTMTCRQLGGACNLEFHADTFEKMAGQSKEHGTEMFQKGDEAHLKVMKEMSALMKDPKATQAWMDARKKEFDALSEDH